MTDIKDIETHGREELFEGLRGVTVGQNKSAFIYENCRIGVFFFIYLTWLENGCRESPEELCALVRQIVQKTF